MSFDLLGDVKWLSVILAALAYFVIGAIWYAPPVLGKAWMAAGGIEMPADGQRPGPAESRRRYHPAYDVPLRSSTPPFAKRLFLSRRNSSHSLGSSRAASAAPPSTGH